MGSVVPLKNSQTNSYAFHLYNIKDLAYPKNDGMVLILRKSMQKERKLLI